MSQRDVLFRIEKECGLDKEHAPLTLFEFALKRAHFVRHALCVYSKLESIKDSHYFNSSEFFEVLDEILYEALSVISELGEEIEWSGDRQNGQDEGKGNIVPLGRYRKD